MPGHKVNEYEVRCVKCGYDVRAQDSSQVCPECAHPVNESRRVATIGARRTELFQHPSVIATYGLTTVAWISLIAERLALPGSRGKGPVLFGIGCSFYLLLVLVPYVALKLTWIAAWRPEENDKSRVIRHCATAALLGGGTIAIFLPMAKWF